MPPRRVGRRVEHGLPRAGIARPALERGVLGVDQAAPLRGVLGPEQRGQRHVGEERVGVIRVAIGHGELEGLDDRVDRLRAIVPHRLQVEALEDLQGLEQVRALGPGAALVDGQAAIADGDRLLDPRRVGGQVDVADQAAVGARPGVDAAGDRPAVERVGDQSEAARAIGLRRTARSGRSRSAPAPRRRPASRASGRSRRARLGARPVRAAVLASARRPGRRSSCRTGRAASGRRRAPRGPPPASIPLAGIPPRPLKSSRVASRGAAPWPAITVTPWCCAS